MYFCLAIPLLQEVKSWLLLTVLGQLSALIKVISALPFALKNLHPVLMSRKIIFMD